MSTVVKNPVHRSGMPPFKQCKYCLGRFTALGLPRHWDHCVQKKLLDDKLKKELHK